MTELKLIDKDTDLSILYPLNWDAVMGDKEYQVYSAEGYIHSIGGRWGENNYWACPRGETPSFDNLIEFSGHAPAWGISIQESNYYKCKWDEPEMRSGCRCVITRNGEPFYTVSCSDIAYGYAEAYRLLRTKIQEGVINFHMYHFWETDIEGRHINYMGRPYTLHQYMHGQCCAMAFPGWRTIEEIVSDPKYGCAGELKIDLLQDGRIDWFPKEAKD